MAEINFKQEIPVKETYPFVISTWRGVKDDHAIVNINRSNLTLGNLNAIIVCVEGISTGYKIASDGSPVGDVYTFMDGYNSLTESVGNSSTLPKTSVRFNCESDNVLTYCITRIDNKKTDGQLYNSNNEINVFNSNNKIFLARGQLNINSEITNAPKVIKITENNTEVQSIGNTLFVLFTD
jgi:hypothetical protein